MAELVVFSSNGDWIRSGGAAVSYADARAGIALLAGVSNGSDPVVGQKKFSNIFQCYEGFCDFDTSSLGVGATVSAATESFHLTSKSDGLTCFMMLKHIFNNAKNAN